MAKKDADREKRLAAALRENLKRRKAQARESGDAGDEDKDPGVAGAGSHPGEGRDP